MTSTRPRSSTAGNWKQSDFPAPVGITARVSDSSISTLRSTAAWPGRNRVCPNCSNRVRSSSGAVSSRVAGSPGNHLVSGTCTGGGGTSTGPGARAVRRRPPLSRSASSSVRSRAASVSRPARRSARTFAAAARSPCPSCRAASCSHSSGAVSAAATRAPSASATAASSTMPPAISAWARPRTAAALGRMASAARKCSSAPAQSWSWRAIRPAAISGAVDRSLAMSRIAISSAMAASRSPNASRASTGARRAWAESLAAWRCRAMASAPAAPPG